MARRFAHARTLPPRPRGRARRDLLSASTADAAPAPGTFVAALDDRPALNLGLVTDGRRVAAYLCDQGRRSVWFDGRFRGTAAALLARGRRG